MRDADNAAFQKALRDHIKDAVHYDGYSFQAGWQAALAYAREGTAQKPVAVTECRVNGMSHWGRFDKPEGWLEFRSTGGACVVLAPGSALHDVTISAGGLLTGDKDQPFKLENGKYYRLRNGAKVGPIAVCVDVGLGEMPTPASWVSPSGWRFRWRLDGRETAPSGLNLGEYDIVAEWTNDLPRLEVPDGYWLAPMALTPALRAAGAEGSGEDSEAVAEGAYEAIRDAALGAFSPAAGGYVERMAAVTESSGDVFRDLNVSPPEKE
ncbi:hypothetical protein V5F49_20685 [Xanthobacter sp. V3C-3]|uniref:hypothetical protein n=1 Tax=Xanthobacter lutulentifluminis TaxID=3119935 RepID=UPI00372B4A99